MVYNKMYESNDKETGLDAMAGDSQYEEAKLSDHLRFKMTRDGKRFWAGDNISDYVTEEHKAKLIDEATVALTSIRHITN